MRVTDRVQGILRRLGFELSPSRLDASPTGNLWRQAVNWAHTIGMTLLATLLTGCASQTSPCRSIDLQDPDNEGVLEYCRDSAPLRALEVAVADEAYALLTGVELSLGAAPSVNPAFVMPTLPATQTVESR